MRAVTATATESPVTSFAAALPADGISRAELAQSRIIWRVHGVMLWALASTTAVLAFWLTDVDQLRMLAFAGLLAACGVSIIATRPPKIGTPQNHVALFSVYGLVGLGEFAYEPNLAVSLGAAAFISTLLALRLTVRREIGLHLVAASVCLLLPPATASADAGSLLGTAAVLFAVWSLTACCAMVFESVELQGVQLRELSRLDPLTGAGNQRALSEGLEQALADHSRERSPFSLIGIDLDGFSATNEAYGRAAGDDVLVRAATAIAAVAGPGSLVARPANDEFWLVIPDADPAAAMRLGESIRETLSTIGARGSNCGVTAAIGVASYPRDAVNGGVLLDVAREALLDDDAARPAPGLVDADAGAYEAEPRTELRGLSRTDLAGNRSLLVIGSGIAIVIAGLSVLAAAAGPGTVSPRVIGFVVFVLLTSMITVSSGPPPIHSARNHLLLGLVYSSSALGFWALEPRPEGAIAVSVFIAPLIAARLQDRRVIATHFALATFAFAAVAGVGLLTDDLSQNTLLAITLVVPTIWVLGVSCVLTLERAEAQGRALQELVRSDAVTGVGNRFVLTELLDAELHPADRAPDPTSLLTIEILGKFGVGRVASDVLLSRAAAALAEAVGPRDVVIRRRAHEFAVVLPDAKPSAVDHTVEVIHAALSCVETDSGPIGFVHGWSSAPSEGTDTRTLLRIADERLQHARADLHRPQLTD